MLLELFEDLFEVKPSKLVKYDVETKEDHYLVKLYTPGVKKEDLKLEVIDGRLKLNISDSEYSQEIKINSSMLDTIDANILAKYTDGVLNIMIPKVNHISKEINIL